MPERKLQSQQISEGAGARVRRLFPIQERNDLDPFVLFDEFTIAPDAGFPDHPHRGFEAVTYLFEGAMHHRDNLGNDAVIKAGGALHFTAGQGLVHSEMPGSAGPARGIQLWVNLAQAEKGVSADYEQVLADDLPETRVDGCRIRTVVGPGSPLHLHSDIRYLDVELAPGSSEDLEVPEGWCGMVYVVSGQLRTDHTSANAGEGLALDAGRVKVFTGPGARFEFILGRPFHQPVHHHGTFVD